MAKRLSTEYVAGGQKQPAWDSPEGLKQSAQRLARKSQDGVIPAAKLAGYTPAQQQIIIAEFKRVWHPDKTVYSQN